MGLLGLWEEKLAGRTVCGFAQLSVSLNSLPQVKCRTQGSARSHGGSALATRSFHGSIWLVWLPDAVKSLQTELPCSQSTQGRTGRPVNRNASAAQPEVHPALLPVRHNRARAASILPLTIPERDFITHIQGWAEKSRLLCGTCRKYYRARESQNHSNNSERKGSWNGSLQESG